MLPRKPHGTPLQLVICLLIAPDNRPSPSPSLFRREAWTSFPVDVFHAGGEAIYDSLLLKIDKYF